MLLSPKFIGVIASVSPQVQASYTEPFTSLQMNEGTDIKIQLKLKAEAKAKWNYLCRCGGG